MANATLRLLLAGVVVLLAACGQRADVALARQQQQATTAASAPSEAPAVDGSAEPDVAAQKRTRRAPAPMPAPMPARTPVPASTPTTVTSPQPLVAQPSRAPRNPPSEQAAPTDWPTDPAQRLWDRSFASVSVTVNGQQQPLVEDSRLLINPNTDPRQAVRFNGGATPAVRPCGSPPTGSCSARTGGAALRIAAMTV